MTSCWFEDVQAKFLSILPRLKTHARIAFRHIRCSQRRADCIDEMIALAWRWFVRLAERGKDATQFAAGFAGLAARAVKSGRKVAGMVKSRDVMNELTQRRQSFVVGKLPDFSTFTTNPLAEALIDNTVSPVPEQVAFRCDFPSWTRTRTQRDRRIIHDMAMGERTMPLSRKFGISPARISQLRREFHDDWENFTADVVTA